MEEGKKTPRSSFYKESGLKMFRDQLLRSRGSFFYVSGSLLEAQWSLFEAKGHFGGQGGTF